MGRMDGKVAFITGGARGQGRAHALTLAKEGADVVLFDIAEDIDSLPYGLATKDDLSSTAAEVEALDRRVIAVQGDTRSQAALDAAVARTIDELGQIDVLVANSGIWAVSPFWQTSEQEWQDQLDVNLTGHWHAAKAVTPHMIERGTGAIVFTSSANGLVAGPGYAHYTASKHGVIGLMKTVAVELGPYGIRANAVCPAFVDTKMNDWQGVYDMMAGTGEGTGTPEDRVNAAKHLSAIKGRGFIAPESVSKVVLWLASDDAADISGHAHPVDAGGLALPQYNPAPVL
jgi:SDR family mycofactocin-dependent oxidoreductase